MGMRHYNQGAVRSLAQVTVFTATTRYGAGIEYCKFRGKYVTILYAQKDVQGLSGAQVTMCSHWSAQTSSQGLKK